MICLYHVPFCPLSRKVWMGLREKRIPAESMVERIEAPSSGLISIDPLGTLPTLVDHDIVCSGDYSAVEYLDEVYPTPLLTGTSPQVRAEVRRLISWADRILYNDVYITLFFERILKGRLFGGGPDSGILRDGKTALKEHMALIEKLADERKFLGGDAFSWADIAIATQLSCVDYFGDIPWDRFSAACVWYMKIKSRSSFRPFLELRVPGVPPASCYGNLDF